MREKARGNQKKRTHNRRDTLVLPGRVEAVLYAMPDATTFCKKKAVKD